MSPSVHNVFSYNDATGFLGASCVFIHRVVVSMLKKLICVCSIAGCNVLRSGAVGREKKQTSQRENFVALFIFWM